MVYHFLLVEDGDVWILTQSRNRPPVCNGDIGGIFALARVADTLKSNRSDLEEDSLLVLISPAVIRSNICRR